MKILNLTQHQATPEQLEAGVVEPRDKDQVMELLTFDELPTIDDMIKRSEDLAKIAYCEEKKTALIGGAPFLMRMLEEELERAGIQPVYAFSKRESVEKIQEDGSVKKVNVFKHIGFVYV